MIEQLPKSSQEALMAQAEELSYPSNTVIIHEGHVENAFYLLSEGQVEIIHSENDKTYSLNRLGPGEIFGEMAMIDEGPRSASVKTLSACKVYRFDIQKLKNNPQTAFLLDKINANLAISLSQRLRKTDQLASKALQERFALSIFTLWILVAACFYTLSLSFIEKAKSYFPNTTPLSIGLIVVFTWVAIAIIRKGGFNLEFYGLSLKNAKKNIIEAILYTLPFLALVVLIKFVALKTIPSISMHPLFDPSAMFRQGVPFNLTIYFTSMFFYALFCPVQEFIARGCIQTSLQKLIDTNTALKWRSILISNLVFASTHSHTSIGFALSVFIPGLFWGYLYSRQNTLLGVSVSHIMVGVWCAFIVGFENIF